MNTIERIDQLTELAQQLGYQVRYDYFGGTGGGICQISGAKYLFLDLALTSAEQLDVLRRSLAHEPLMQTVASPELMADLNRAA